jgi:hypothetical protein
MAIFDTIIVGVIVGATLLGLVYVNCHDCYTRTTNNNNPNTGGTNIFPYSNELAEEESRKSQQWRRDLDYRMQQENYHHQQRMHNMQMNWIKPK